MTSHEVSRLIQNFISPVELHYSPEHLFYASEDKNPKPPKIKMTVKALNVVKNNLTAL